MIHIRGKIPITIHPFFWLTAALLGFLSTRTFLGTLIWIGVILISVLIHELGHASTAIAFGLKPRIELVALGGLTYHRGDQLPFWKQFIIVLNGPVFGFCLFLVAWGLLKLPALATGLLSSIFTLFFWINLIWTVLNLVPVMPLDGGQLLRIVLESIFGPKGFRYSLMVGMIIATGVSLFFFLFQNFLIGALFFLFAFQSFDMYRKMRNFTKKDQSSHLKQALEAAEKDLQEGNKDKALSSFEKIRTEAKEGVIFMLATQYLAFLKNDLGRSKEAYNLLYPLRADLSSDALCLLHKVAFEQDNFDLVAELGPGCFTSLQSPEVALRNAFACAQLSQAKPAIGWLETAFQEGLDNLQEVLSSSYFDTIRSEPIFKKFLDSHSLS